MLGGTEFGEDTGYGPPRYLTPGEVGRAAAGLKGLDVAGFEAKIDLGELSDLGVYPDIWDRDDERDLLIEYVREGYAAVRGLFAGAAATGDAMVVLCT